MPNWCDNVVIISGDEPTLNSVKVIANAAIRNNDYGLFNAFVPMPEELRGTTSPGKDPNGFINAMAGNTDYKYDNWYDWSLANWGTKWDVTEINYDFFNNYGDDFVEDPTLPRLMMSFSTAWAPANEFWRKFSEKYPTLKVINLYEESGMNFAGKFVCQAGEVVEDNFINDITSEQYKSIGAVLDKNGNVDWDADQEYDIYDLFK